MKVIFITGYWKSGTTLLQFLLARDNNIDNVFPRDGINYDGTEFWKKYIPSRTSHNGHYIPPRIIENIDIKSIKEQLNEFHDDSKFLLLKRPQFVMNDVFIKTLYPDAHIIATTRDLLPNIYSMLRMRKLNNYIDDVIVGQYIPGWKQIRDKEPIERLVLQYCYISNYIDKHGISTVDYGELCDNTEETINQIGKYIGHKFSMEIPDITNCNIDYIEGTTIKSRNDKTATGYLSITKDNKDFPPLTPKEIDKIHKYYDKYEDVEVI